MAKGLAVLGRSAQAKSSHLSVNQNSRKSTRQIPHSRPAQKLVQSSCQLKARRGEDERSARSSQLRAFKAKATLPPVLNPLVTASMSQIAEAPWHQKHPGMYV